MDCIYTALLSKALYNIASHSPIHTPTAVPTVQGNKQHVWCRHGPTPGWRKATTSATMVRGLGRSPMARHWSGVGLVSGPPSGPVDLSWKRSRYQSNRAVESGISNVVECNDDANNVGLASKDHTRTYICCEHHLVSFIHCKNLECNPYYHDLPIPTEIHTPHM